MKRIKFVLFFLILNGVSVQFADALPAVQSALNAEVVVTKESIHSLKKQKRRNFFKPKHKKRNRVIDSILLSLFVLPFFVIGLLEIILGAAFFTQGAIILGIVIILLSLTVLFFGLRRIKRRYAKQIE